ncbi:hypothetical protein [Parabacteroides sp.]|uniref:hypothetical protein n=1 Tax=Parabacteroides sp. TaxID=1869337 RepID=UPI00257A7386|nr:hypothetical protein [Parabacteroides sp.]
MVRSYINGLVWLALLLSLPSCSEETMPEVREGRVYSFTVVSGSKDPNATADEGIRTVTLVFTDNDDTIVEVDEIKSDEFAGASSAPVLCGTVILKVAQAATTVYAFANLDSELLEQKPSFTLGTKFNKDAIAQITQSLTVGTNQAIPMSSRPCIITDQGGTIEQPYDRGEIPLYRMIAKVHVTLTNNTDKEVTINSLSLGDFQYRDICLLPYEGLEKVDNNDETTRPSFPKTNTPITTYPLPIVSGATNVAASAVFGQDLYQYVHETDLGENNPIKVAATINNEVMTPGGDTKFTFVRRNDYLRIPLLLSKNQLVISMEETYAPIGGYPFKNTSEGTEISVHEGSVVRLQVGIRAFDGTLSPLTSGVTLTKQSGSIEFQENNGTLTAQIPAQPTNEENQYTLTIKTGNTTDSRKLTLQVNPLTASALSASALRTSTSPAAILVLKEFYQLSY